MSQFLKFILIFACCSLAERLSHYGWQRFWAWIDYDREVREAAARLSGWDPRRPVWARGHYVAANIPLASRGAHVAFEHLLVGKSRVACGLEVPGVALTWVPLPRNHWGRQKVKLPCAQCLHIQRAVRFADS